MATLKAPITREDFANLTTYRAVAVGLTFMPAEMQPRMRQLVAELEARESASLDRGRRNALIREHDRRFNEGIRSLTQRAKAIEDDFRRASSVTVPTAARVASAKSILAVWEGKMIGWKQIMNFIQ